MKCHVCGGAFTVTTTRTDYKGQPLDGISHCASEPAHNVGEPYLSVVRAALAREVALPPAVADALDAHAEATAPVAGRSAAEAASS